MASINSGDPRVVAVEQDFTRTVESQLTNTGAITGVFTWGPINKATRITTGEQGLLDTFGKPSDDTYIPFLTAADFLNYSNDLWVVRGSGELARNSVPTGETAVYIPNEDAYDDFTFPVTVDFIGKYPGTLGNGIIIDIADAAKFETWEYKSQFDFVPKPNEYSIAVIDGSGAISGTGGRGQQERMTISGAVTGGVSEVQEIAVSGVAAGGIAQQEELTFTGTVTADDTLVIGGVNVAVLTGDDANTVASKAAIALASDAQYSSAVAVANVLTVTYAVVGPQTIIPDLSQSGITMTVVITVNGDDTFTYVIDGENVVLTNGDDAATAAGKIATVLNGLAKYTSAIAAGTVVTLTYASQQAELLPPNVNANGIQSTFSVVTPGDNTVVITVASTPVTVINTDTNSQIATKIATALETATVIINSTVAGDVITYNRTANGVLPPITDFTDSGVTGTVVLIQSGTLGTLIEKYETVTNDPNAEFDDGTTKYFVDAINNNNNSYILVGNQTVLLSARTVELQGAVDDNVGVDLTGFMDLLKDDIQIDVRIMIGGGLSIAEQRKLADITTQRTDSVAYLSVPFSTVVNNSGQEASDIEDYMINQLSINTSYAFVDSNWGYVYDKYNRKRRWIPLCGGTAGLVARLPNSWSNPAGNNGIYSGISYERLAWTPNKDQRDILARNRVNSVVQGANGIRLNNNLTAQTSKSAFSEVNIRNLFIDLRKSISTASEPFLNELNNSITRSQFENTIRPYLRTIVGAGAAFSADLQVEPYDPAQPNTLNATIRVAPVGAIKYINLTFAAVNSELIITEI